MSLRAIRRRSRKIDPLATPSAVRALLNKLSASLPATISGQDKELVRILRAVRHIGRYSATDTRRGRPPRWQREDLLLVERNLAALLARETNNKIGTASFIDHYLRILDFPDDLVQALESGQINLFEASQLARIRARHNGLTKAEAQRQRRELLTTHLQAKLSGTRLRLRVNDLLAPTSKPPRIEEMALLEDFDLHDPFHLFWEEIKQLGFAFREIERQDLNEALLEELLKASQPLWSVLQKIKNRKKRAVKKLPL